MKYADDVERSAEYLRRALPLMSRQTAALHPISYAVWYEYVSGRNPPLNASIDSRTRDGVMLDEQATLEIFQKHIAEIDEEISRRVSEGIQKALSDMLASAARAGEDASAYGRILEKWSTDLAATKPGAGLGSAVDLLLQHTRDMQTSAATLKASLSESRREIEQLREEVIRVRRDALFDGLTGLMNRRGFDAALNDCLSACEDAAGPCLLLLDVDRFKQINDSYGHLLGDKVLGGIAQILKDNVKGRDVAARYGGEEFVVLLPATKVADARRLAERIRSDVADCRIRRADRQESVGNITISIGVAGYGSGESAQQFIARADRALYASKNNGRNRVTVAAAAVIEPSILAGGQI